MRSKSNKTSTPFDRFHNFAKLVIAVPHKEVQEQLRKYKKHKKRKSRTATPAKNF